MIPGIRPATQEEIDQIKDKADLTPLSAVWTWPNEKGEPVIAVLRNCMEVDPVFFGEGCSNHRKLLFMWAFLNMLRGNGTKEAYLSIDADSPQEYIDTLKNIGAEQTTVKPQLRFKVIL